MQFYQFIWKLFFLEYLIFQLPVLWLKAKQYRIKLTTPNKSFLDHVSKQQW